MLDHLNGAYEELLELQEELNIEEANWAFAECFNCEER